MKIRRAEKGDIPALIRLRAFLLDQGDAVYSATDPASRKAWKEVYGQWLVRRLGSDDAVTLIAERGWDRCVMGIVTGIVDARPPGPDCITGRSGWVQSLVVHPSSRKRGVSSALMGELMAWFGSSGVSKVALQSTADAEHLYRGLGFQQADEPTYQRRVCA